MSKTTSTYVVNLACDDQIGIVAATSRLLASNNFNILTSCQFRDPGSNRFFMRISIEGSAEHLAKLRDGFGETASQFGMTWKMWDAEQKPRILVMVSKFGHCLNDLLYRQSIGSLNAVISVVISNHEAFRSLTEAYGVPFVYLPVEPSTKQAQEERLLNIMSNFQVELLVLARYMQVLSPELCDRLKGRAINIHHSFLPSFKGAGPYQQAYKRGVKLIGATAHYVTSDLDEGPIIEQEVCRVDHAATPDELTALGRDVECVVLARAVQAHLDRCVFINGTKTVVFR